MRGLRVPSVLLAQCHRATRRHAQLGPKARRPGSALPSLPTENEGGEKQVTSGGRATEGLDSRAHALTHCEFTKQMSAERLSWLGGVRPGYTPSPGEVPGLEAGSPGLAGAMLDGAPGGVWGGGERGCARACRGGGAELPRGGLGGNEGSSGGSRAGWTGRFGHRLPEPGQPRGVPRAAWCDPCEGQGRRF